MARTKEFDTEEVLSKAVGLFWSKGYNGASMQEIVDCLGLSRSSIYDTFGDKHQLFMEVLKKYSREGGDNLLANLADTPDIRGFVKKFFDAAIKDGLEDKECKGCFIVNTTIELAPHNEEIKLLVQQNMASFEDAFTKAFAKGQAEGKIAKGLSARALARFVFNNISGIRVVAKSGADKKVLDDIVKVAMSVL